MDDYEEYRMEEFLADYFDSELKRLAEEPVFYFLARNGDAIEARVLQCLHEGRAMLQAGFPAASLTRIATGIEIVVRFFLARPLLQGAFLSDEWSALLSKQIFNDRTTKDRELLPAILRNWKIDITSTQLPSGGQLWEAIVARVWRKRNDCVHKGSAATPDEALLAATCLEALLSEIVSPLALRLGFTRDRTHCWSIVAAPNPPEYPDLNPAREYERTDPFAD